MEEGKEYRIEISEDDIFTGIFVACDRGFYLFESGGDVVPVRPSSIISIQES